jgi:hypothetical protein
MKLKKENRRFLIWGLGVSFFALYAFYSTGSVQLVCERLQPNQVSCEQTRTRLYGIINTSQRTLELSGARVESVVDIYDPYTGPYFRAEVWLETSQGTLTFPALRYNPSRREANKRAEQIRQYIQGEGAADLKWNSGSSIVEEVASTIVVGGVLFLATWLLAAKPKA